MHHSPSSSTRSKLWDYFILTARLLLAYTFWNYGYAKLTGNQFGLSSAELAQPVNKLSLFKLSWYLFDQDPFKTFVGASQIVAGLLLLWNRTALIGALMLLPIALNVLVIDITYVKLSGFYWRLSYYILLLNLIFWHYRSQMQAAWVTMTTGVKPRFRYAWWAYALLPVAAAGAELLGAMPQVLLSFLSNPAGTWRSLEQLCNMLLRR